MRADQQGRIPVPAVGLHARSRYRLDGHFFAADPVETRQPPVLGLRVNDVGVAGVDLRLKTIAFLRYKPVRVHNAPVVDRARRPAQGEIVLGSAVYIIEGGGVVYGHAVELRDGQVGLVVPRSGIVPGLVQTAVASHQEVRRVFGIHPKRMVVHVFPRFAYRTERLSAVPGHLSIGVHRIYRVHVVGRSKNFGIIISCRRMVAHFGPRSPPVLRPVETTALYRGVDHIRIYRGNRHANPANFATGETVAGLGPGLTAVAADLHSALGSARNIGPFVPTALVGRGIQNIRIALVHMNLIETGVVGYMQNARPRFSAVGRLVDASFAAAVPYRSVGRHIHRIRLCRVDGYHANAFRRLQSHVFPGLPAVQRLVQAIAVGHRPLVVVFSGPNPDGSRVLGIYRHTTDGVGGLVVKNGIKRNPVVFGFPNPAAGCCNVPGVRFLRIDGKVGNPARRGSRTNGPPFERA